jgi:hypothetical protein
MRNIALGCAALGLFASACQDPVVPRTSGTALVKARAIDLFVAPSGQYVATLTDAGPSKDLGAPPDILQGTLMVAPVAGGPARKVGNYVPNTAGKVLYSTNGAYLACLADFSVAQGAGELHLVRTAGGDAESLADGVTYFAFSPDGDTIAYISRGALFLRPTAGGEARQIAASVSVFEFGPSHAGGTRLLVKRSVNSGRGLFLYEASGDKTTDLARGVGAFGFSPDGVAFVFQADTLLVPGILDSGAKAPLVKAPPKDSSGFYRVIGNSPPKRLSTDGVAVFKFAPKSTRVAWVTRSFGSAPVGDLYVADEDVKKIAQKVQQFSFAPDGTIYLLGAYDPSSNAGTVGYQPPTGALVELAHNVKEFTVTPQSKYLLYSEGISINNTFTYALEVHRIGAPADEKPRRIDTGVFGYVVDQQEQRLAYKARCVDAGKACNLYVADLEHAAESTLLAQRVAAFQFAPAPHGLVVVTSQHEGKLTGRLIFSLGLVAATPNAPVQVLDDQMNGDFVLAGAARDRIVYVVAEKDREGLYSTGLAAPAQPVTTQTH